MMTFIGLLLFIFMIVCVYILICLAADIDPDDTIPAKKVKNFLRKYLVEDKDGKTK